MLDLIIDYNARHNNLNYPLRQTRRPAFQQRAGRDMIDQARGAWGREVAMDSTTTYEGPAAAESDPAEAGRR